MPNYETGSVILVNFPFTDLLSSKVRPALVLAPHGDDVIILGIFSKIPEVLQPSWVKIDQHEAYFRQTGLKKTSIIKTEKITVLHKSLIKRNIGQLPPTLLSFVRKTILRTLLLD
jgi:mRNA interferase MazF